MADDYYFNEPTNMRTDDLTQRRILKEPVLIKGLKSSENIGSGTTLNLQPEVLR